jgi:hypothetical protein
LTPADLTLIAVALRRGGQDRRVHI